MKFVDEASITVESGDGGEGCVSFRREKFIERGGPDGGDGGKGGSVTFISSSQKRTLYKFRHQNIVKARRGEAGKGQQKNGKDGDSITLEVPVGTIISNAETGETLFDFENPNQEFIVARGGIGGRGNRRFVSATNRAPRYAQPGLPGEMFSLKLELKSMADIGLLGFPNAGKSTLISTISSARPKIGSYPFTTLTPNIGMVTPDYGEPYAVADIPGIIEGASKGVGLGIQFLKHVERTKYLLHLVDTSEIDPDDPLLKLNQINNELKEFSTKLSEKTQIIALTKLDLTDSEEKADLFINLLKDDIKVFKISAATGRGIVDLKNYLSNLVNEVNDEK
ncbi:MAG: GTPase ObgE [Desulfobacterales bacterium]|nr:GTPase ObgE [Desulfobacterales bacterium]MCP4162340.1 GTPase ObgE [Deltaproteobacteria bacterium]